MLFHPSLIITVLLRARIPKFLQPARFYHYSSPPWTALSFSTIERLLHEKDALPIRRLAALKKSRLKDLGYPLIYTTLILQLNDFIPYKQKSFLKRKPYCLRHLQLINFLPIEQVASYCMCTRIHCHTKR